jgi:hypothetical protein
MTESLERIVNDQFFDKGWCWMAHPDYNIGNPVPVFMYEADGERFFVPLDPSEGGEFVWDERDDSWEMVQPPMADEETDTALDLFFARVTGGHLAALVDELRAEIAALKAPKQGETPKPYAYEFGRSNGDGTYSIFIERGDAVQTGPRSFESGPPRDPHPDHPVKPLYEHPAGVALPRAPEPLGWICEEDVTELSTKTRCSLEVIQPFHDDTHTVSVYAAQPAAQADGKLWCVNVQGPDDVYAMPSKAAALEHANELNVYFAGREHHEYDPIMRAFVIEWPHSAESFAESLAQGPERVA